MFNTYFLDKYVLINTYLRVYLNPSFPPPCCSPQICWKAKSLSRLDQLGRLLACLDCGRELKAWHGTTDWCLTDVCNNSCISDFSPTVHSKSGEDILPHPSPPLPHRHSWGQKMSEHKDTVEGTRSSQPTLCFYPLGTKLLQWVIFTNLRSTHCICI